MVKRIIPLYEAVIHGTDLGIDIIYYAGLQDKDKVLDRFPLTVGGYYKMLSLAAPSCFWFTHHNASGMVKRALFPR